MFQLPALCNKPLLAQGLYSAQIHKHIIADLLPKWPMREQTVLFSLPIAQQFLGKLLSDSFGLAYTDPTPDIVL